MALILSFTHVSFAQDESHGFKQAIEKQIQIPAVADFKFISEVSEIQSLNEIKPLCMVNAYAETVKHKGIKPKCTADADYGSHVSFLSYFYKENLLPKQLFANDRPLTHSSGGLPFIRC